MTEREQLKSIVDNEMLLRKLRATTLFLSNEKRKAKDEYLNRKSDIEKKIDDVNAKIKEPSYVKVKYQTTSKFILMCILPIIGLILLSLLFSFLSSTIGTFFAWLMILGVFLGGLYLILLVYREYSIAFFGFVIAAISAALEYATFYFMNKWFGLSTNEIIIIISIILGVGYLLYCMLYHYKIDRNKVDRINNKRYQETLKNKKINMKYSLQASELSLENFSLENKYESIIKTIDSDIISNEKEIEKTELQISKLYQILEPNYRNVGIAALFYEYLCQERCNSIKGVNGAYSLYMQERLITSVDQFASSTRASISSLNASTTYLSDRIDACDRDIKALKQKRYINW